MTDVNLILVIFYSFDVRSFRLLSMSTRLLCPLFSRLAFVPPQRRFDCRVDVLRDIVDLSGIRSLFSRSDDCDDDKPFLDNNIVKRATEGGRPVKATPKTIP
jgi:hypothetical protein